MGLDMYLKGKKFVWGDFENPENNSMMDGYKISEYILELGYWRKHPNLHGYIVNTFGGGLDECQEIDLSEENIENIINTVKSDALPEGVGGFFFGKSATPNGEYKECYEEQKAKDIKILTNALDWIKTKDKHMSRYIVYQASW